MATLEKIRNNAGLLVSIVIGLALLAFILGDLFKSGNPMDSKSRTEIAEIGGNSVGVQMYQVKVDENIESYKRNTGQSSLDQPTMERIRQQTWDDIVREYLMIDSYDELGIQISGYELMDMVSGNNIDPQVMQIPIFQNEETGQFDKNLVLQFLKNMELDPSGKAQTSWVAFEKALVQQKVDQKYNTLIEKGLFITSLQAKKEAENKNLKVDFDYVDVKYNTVSDSSIFYNDKDLQAYYNKNIDQYTQEEIRGINYVTFPVVASQEDEKQTKEYIENIKAEFEAEANNEQFISLNSDLPFDGQFYAEAELPESIRSLFAESEGTIVGEYKEENAYKISKVVEFKDVPDSVEARHILLRPEAGVDAVGKADSLLDVIKTKGGDFAELAKTYSQDGSASNGGDLGWFLAGAMVKPFSNACFFGEKGDLVIVNSQFGVHVVEILEQSKKTRKVQIATVARTIEPSTKTYQNTYAEASKFGGSNRTYDAFVEASKAESYNLKIANVKRDDKNVANLEDPRQLIRWAYKAETGEVSEIFELGDVFVVATLKSAQEEGTAPYANVSMEVEREVKKEKKAEYLISKMAKASKNASTIQVVADNMHTVFKEAKNVTFAAYSIGTLGFEPEVQAAAVQTAIDQISEPIKGKNGVYVIQVKNIQKPAEDMSVMNDKNFLTRSYRSRVGYQVYEAIKEASEITDNRSNFY
ncbi:MAG: SurA N-terminal domain-containing protein [Salinivirgaceae bacterium]|jgi:peptidyl-prolyl cis-trans isomerase D|nr:SurA N-terminal domain-containing protein [Salinivirgaceae bacterium]